MGITGNSQGHKRPIQQFNTPGLPYVMIGTDTIREVDNLHLFCDRAMYYGVAWRGRLAILNSALAGSTAISADRTPSDTDGQRRASATVAGSPLSTFKQHVGAPADRNIHGA
ncbi:hypothetical protein [Pseudomonas sp. Irchel s3f7]|uniref:hypothetical protein n=1 Tax=Pseudomonas sp. Irchel s3f7 TaxID=2009153 RepID=UPI001179BE04|nr:hypothetical protein [Pseudomonas sp. Irchel s3f7]